MRGETGWASGHSLDPGKPGRSAKCSRREFIKAAGTAAGAGVLGGVLGRSLGGLTGGSASAAAGWTLPAGEITETFWDSTSFLKTSLLDQAAAEFDRASKS